MNRVDRFGQNFNWHPNATFSESFQTQANPIFNKFTQFFVSLAFLEQQNKILQQ
jgi:hypothetical protein